MALLRYTVPNSKLQQQNQGPLSSKLAILRVCITQVCRDLHFLTFFIGIAYLAQSPQLAKQMAIAADFERVYEIGPVFRAEDSNTHRHLTEFIGLDLEMTIEEHYHEVLELLDGLFLSIFEGLEKEHKSEIELIGKQFPADEYVTALGLASRSRHSWVGRLSSSSRVLAKASGVSAKAARRVALQRSMSATVNFL